MAIRAAGRRYGWDGEDGFGVGVIGLSGGYHGDTVSSISAVINERMMNKADWKIGSMDASEPSTFNKAVDW